MLAQFKITQFRNFSEFSVVPHAQWTLIEGPNGSGKSSLLEAIYFFAQGKSFRSVQLNRLIQQGKSEFTLFGNWKVPEHVYSIGVQRSLLKDAEVRMDGQTLKNHLPVTRLIPALVFNPEQFSALMMSSKIRRQVLDWGSFYHFPPFLSAWQMYRQALAQRNAGLKQNLAKEAVVTWDKLLVKSALELNAYRLAYMEKLSAVLKQMIGLFLSQHDITVSYYPGWSAEQSLEEALAGSFAEDKDRGFTFYGPHRADLRFKVRQLPASEVLSRGQQKLLACALKLAQAFLLETHTPHQALLLLDDVLSEFDIHNAQLILSELKKLKAQLFLTCIDGTLLSGFLAGNEYVRCLLAG